MKNRIDVCFRKFDNGDIIALFPNEPYDLEGNIMSYMHIGQHSGASPELVDELEPTNGTEHYKLWTELLTLGYVLNEVD